MEISILTRTCIHGFWKDIKIHVVKYKYLIFKALNTALGLDNNGMTTSKGIFQGSRREKNL